MVNSVGVLSGCALVYAKAFHDGQLYGDECYFEKHLCGVANMLISSGASDLEVAVGYLHDVLEDTDADFEGVKAVFGEEVAIAVESLTKRNGESLECYIKRCSTNKTSMKVKYHDSLFNLMQSNISGNKKRITKYMKTLGLLSEFGVANCG